MGEQQHGVNLQTKSRPIGLQKLLGNQVTGALVKSHQTDSRTETEKTYQH